MKKKSPLFYLAIVAGVLIIFAVIGKKAGWFGKNMQVKVSTGFVEQRTIVELITANGKIQPETEVKISPDVSGEIIELEVKEGQEVKAGNLLLKIKPDIYLSNLDRMDAAVNSAKSNLANAKARFAQVDAQFKQAELSFQRNKKLHKEGAISQADYENAQSSYQVARAEVESAIQNINSANFSVKSAEASLKESRENLKKTTIYAPMDGTISRLNVEKGERVVGTELMTGTEILRIANLNKMEVVVEVNENDIVRVNYGDTALIEIDAYIDQKFKGVVTEIANSANVSGLSTDQVTNFNVKILILRASYEKLIPEGKTNYYPFRPGMSATVEIQTETRRNVLSVPIQAVTTRPDSVLAGNNNEQEKDDNAFIEEDRQVKAKSSYKPEDKPDELVEVVFEFKDGMAFPNKVRTGIQDNTYIEIVEGLQDSTEIIIGPYSAVSKKLKNGTEVEKEKKENIYKKED